MAVDEVEELPADLRGWVDDRADELDVTPEVVVERILAAHRDVDRLDDPRVDDVAERLDRLDARLDALEVDVDRTSAGRVDDLETGLQELSNDLDGLIADVRERVIQVKRETDAKAPADHDHADLSAAAERASTTAADLAERLDAVEGRLDDGFADFREVLEHLTDATAELEPRVETLARVAVDQRERITELEADRRARKAAAELRRTANRHGDATAACEACGRRVRLGLLSRPRCPHCDAAFADLDPSGRFFGSATLLTGRVPALDGERDAADTPTDPFESGGTDD